MAIATCAKCGENRELCESVRIDGIKQPRICKDCLLERMNTGDETVSDIYWICQMGELGDEESLSLLRKKYNVTRRHRRSTEAVVKKSCFLNTI